MSNFENLLDIALDCIVENPAVDHWVFTDEEFSTFLKRTIHEISLEVQSMVDHRIPASEYCKLIIERFEVHNG